MAKGQKRSNREIKKPKAKKVAAEAQSSIPAMKGSTVPVSATKKKG